MSDERDLKVILRSRFPLVVILKSLAREHERSAKTVVLRVRDRTARR